MKAAKVGERTSIREFSLFGTYREKVIHSPPVKKEKKKESHKIPWGKHESHTATIQMSTLELAARAMSEERKFNGPHCGLLPFPSWLPPQSNTPGSESRGSNLKPASVKECRNSYLPSCSTS